MSALYENQGREQPLQPQDHSGCNCLACRDEWLELTGPAPVMCNRCNAAEPVEGADQCAVCLQAIADEEAAEATRALVALLDAALEAA